MIAKMVIDKKREGHALGSAEIREFIEGFVAGLIPDYQMSALAMAICCRGMTPRETADLTEAMRNSGRCLEWDIPAADKHSTGGVGDKLSLVIQPLAAACGIHVPSLTGRGLGITGGTADKMETIPGYSCAQSLDRFQEIVRSIGVSLSVQTDDITPADKKLYALRDVTGTVASIPLIVASILSKKLAEGADTLVFDVKFGKGAFMKTEPEAVELAQALVEGARTAGRKASALVTDMNSPLGYAVGNANEVAEALKWLRADVDMIAATPEIGLSIELAAKMVSLCKGIPFGEAMGLAQQKLLDGSAFAKFEEMVTAHGGDLGRFEKLLQRPTFKFRIQAMRSGYVSEIDAERTAKVALMLGAGRLQAGDRIDPLAGVTLSVRVGDRVAVGQPLATLERSVEPEGLEAAAAELYRAFQISATQPSPTSLVRQRID